MRDDKLISFITCVNDDTWYNESLLYLKHMRLPPGMRAEYRKLTGAKSMTAGYNEAMRQSSARYKVYLHQDTFIVNKDFVRDILAIFADETIGALGVIGCRSLPRSGVWWDGLRTYGRVLHACEPESVVDSRCMEPEGAYIDVEAVDGLLIATQYDLPWREDIFTGWHFYDISQCKEFGRRGYKVVVPNQDKDFWCIHCPAEKPLSPEYKKYQRAFLREYGHELHPEV